MNAKKSLQNGHSVTDKILKLSYHAFAAQSAKAGIKTATI
jgi:hypothetical protein